MIKNVYIFSFSNKHAGGLESMHQLCFSLNKIGINSSMVYFPNQYSEIPQNYKKYNLSKSVNVEDHEDNIIVLPETILDIGFNYKKCKKIHYWLSVNFFFELSTRYLSPSIYLNYSIKFLIKSILVKPKYLFKSYGIYKHKLFLTNKKLKSNDIINLAQSEFALEFLKNNNYPNVIYINDFIHSDFFKPNALNSSRDNIILYNPLKGKEFTRKLMDNFPKYVWIPIINLSPIEVSNLLLNSKIYVDFGEHPGRDRIPREAVLSGICIITGKKGSASNKIDISIPEKYKIDESDFDVRTFDILIDDIFNNFESHQIAFEKYRNEILNDEEMMKKNCEFLVHHLNNI